MELLLLSLLLCTLPTVNTVRHLIEDIFDLDASMGAMNHLVIDKNTGKLYVGAVNRIYMLDKNLQVLSEVETGKRLDNPMCSERVHQAKCSLKETYTNSINKALLIDYDNERLIACTTLFHGICEKYHLDDIKKKDDTIYLAMVANNETATTFLFIAPGPEIGEQIKKGNVLYAGVSLTTTGRSNVRDRIPAFCSRNLDDFSLVHTGLSASTAVKIESSLRLSFPVFYIYGFGWEGFSYMVTIQKKNPGAETYISKMLRVCQDDYRFYSYAEVELECMSNGVHYNLVQAVYLGKPGKKLSIAIGIREDEEVMYATFSVSHPNSADAGTDSAVCVYPMRKIRSMFTKNIKSCFTGMGNTGPAQIITPDNCRDTPALKISDDYCGEHEVNQPIDGTMPIKGKAVVTFNQTGTAITMTTVSDYAVIFVGTKNGHIIKIALETQDSGKAYEDVPLMEGSEINSDMFVQNDKDGESEYLYAMTDRKLVKMKLHECSQYTTCGTCLGANDPYCGWCSLENKCSLRTECSEPDQELRWLSYSSQSCTTITSVIPDKIQKEHKKTTQLQLHVKNLPSFNGNYECVFSGLGYTLPTTITTVQLQHQITCETPKPNLLPAIPTGEDHIIMDLAIQIGGSDFVTTQFTFFDCSVHTDCSSCTLSEYPCTWCINNHMCTHNASQECMENILVHDKKSETSTELVGPKQCPRIEIDKSKQNSMFLVPSGTSKKIIVSAVNLQDIQKENIKCYFMMGISGKEVSATVTPGDSPDLSTIECQSVDFSYGEISPKINVPFYINWRNNMALDNPEKIQVSMYKCEAMAITCGDCISMEVWYNCGWCQNDNTCSIYLHCKTDKTWLPREQTCPNVQITSIYPDTGPKDGGTLLTIKGINLGTNFADINGGISVAGVSCNPIESNYEPPHTIVCKTGSFDSIQTGTVRVNIGNKYSASASQKFTYVVPEMRSMDPVKGPVSGGTKVTITGHYLDAGTHVDVNFGTYKCEVLEREKTKIVCRTSEAIETSTGLSVQAEFDYQKVESTVTFEYIEDPEIVTVTPLKGIQSGGISITVTGRHLDSIQMAYMITRHEKYEPSGNARQRRRRRRRTTVEEYRSNCEVPKMSDKVMYCYSPKVSNTTVTPDRVDGVRFWYGFKLDNIEINRTGMTKEVFMVYPDPVFEGFTGNKEKSFQSKTDNYLTINGRNLNLGFNSSDVTVRIGKAYCNVTSIDKHGNQLNCKPPKVQPEPAQGHKYPEIIVQVGRNLTTLVGFLKYDEPETLPLDVIIGLGVGGGVLVLVVVIFFVLWCIKTRENTSMKKKWQIQMDNLEVKVAKECKEAFAELQTDMTELTSDHFGQISIPFWDYRTYCMRVLFPQDEDSHAVIKELDVEFSRREQIDQGLKLFSQLVGNKTFLLTFVRTLEMNKKFSMRDRVNVASLISVALQTRMEYATEILKTLLAELIEKSVEGKNHPKLLLRRTESVAEKMLTNWFTFLLYKFLRECAGEPLFMLYQAIKQQTSKGPVDTVTSEARYSLSEDKLIRQQVDYKPMTIYVKDLDQHISGQQSQAVKVLDCDTISQVKEKILDSIYKNAPFSSRPIKQNVDLVLFAQSPSPEWEQSHVDRMILSDVDSTTKLEGDCKRLNNLAHYQVPEGAYMALVSKQQTPSIYDLSNSSEKSNNSKNFDYKRFDNTLIYNSRSPSLNRTASPQNVQIDIDNNSSNGVKYYHLVKQHDQDGTKEGDRSSKMVSEIYLTRLLATKGTLQQFVDDLFERIFSTVHRGTSLPLAIKYMFDFLDDQALLHNIQDPDVVHTWKSNSLPLRFWVNVIKNPNFVFDIYKSNIVDSCLSVVAQNFMDSCSMSEHKLGKDSPSSKLLYAKDIPTYKKWVDRYYQDIKMMPAISDQDMTAMMTEESRNHSDEFNVNAALFELYKYVTHYNEDLTIALDEDEFARKNRLNVKLEQVHAAMNGQSHC